VGERGDEDVVVLKGKGEGGEGVGVEGVDGDAGGD